MEGGNARAGHQYIKPAVARHRLRHQLGIDAGAGDIGQAIDRAREIDRENPRPIRRQTARGGRADARSRPGNQRAAPGQPARHQAIFSTSFPVLAPENSRMKAG